MWSVTLGREPQNFLGARWIPRLLEYMPLRHRKRWALRLLSFSPHYFLRPDAPEYAGMTFDEYLNAAFVSATASRQRICDELLEPYLDRSMRLLDYGCGPGFLASAVAPRVAGVYACDVSRGALACAAILNPRSNVDYLSLLDGELDKIPAGSIDVVYSFAVAQHLTDEALDVVLARCAAKLKCAGTLILHVQLEDEAWRTEDEWRSDTSLSGRVRYRCGLHCFARSEARYREIVAKHDFTRVRLARLVDLVEDPDSDHRSQALLTAQLQQGPGRGAAADDG